MKIKQIILAAALTATPLSLVSCGKTDRKVADTNASKEKRMPTDEEVMHLAVKKWCEAINERDYDLLGRMYAPTVFLYTRELSRADAVDVHRQAHLKTPDFQQYIKGDVTIEDLPNGDKKVNYMKHTMHDGQSKDYPCYLVMTKIDGKWMIAKESDLVTDENVRRRGSGAPSDAIKGDFDGDGVTDRVWITGTKDSEGWYTSIRFNSDAPALSTLSLKNAPGGYEIVNIGKLDDSGKDYLGLVPFGMAGAWTTFYLKGFDGSKWVDAIEPFTIWVDDDNFHRVKRGSRPGYVTILYNDMDAEDPETAFATLSKSVPLRN